MFAIEVSESGGETYIPLSMRNYATREEAEVQLRSYLAMWPGDTARVVPQ